MNKSGYSFKKLAIPYIVWLFVFAILPIVMMIGLIFMDTEGVSFDEASFTLANFQQLAEKSTLTAFWNSLKFSFVSTVVCGVLGYMVAYRLFKSHIKNKFLILTIMILPMWSNILLRTEALGNIMEPHNVLVDMFHLKHWINIKGTQFSVIIGLIFTYMPFMILSVYNALEKIDYSLEEAALDLGCTETKKFWKVIFPLSFKGVITGSIMVFLPCMSGFAIPEILGKGNIVLIGTIIDECFRNMNYNIGSLLAIIILIIILGSIMLASKVDKEGETLL